MAIAPWRANLQPASFRGAGFHVDVGAKASGRRPVLHEFPKKDVPYAEDMGRKARSFTITAYVISGPNTADYRAQRDALEAALESDGPGLLIHPTRGTFRVQVGPYTSTERRERGGSCEFEITFVEAGQSPSSSASADTQGAAIAAALSAVQSFQGSADIRNLAASSD